MEEVVTIMAGISSIATIAMTCYLIHFIRTLRRENKRKETLIKYLNDEERRYEVKIIEEESKNE